MADAILWAGVFAGLAEVGKHGYHSLAGSTNKRDAVRHSGSFILMIMEFMLYDKLKLRESRY